MEDHRYIVWTNKATFDVQYTFFDGDLSRMFDLDEGTDPEKLALDLEVYVRDYIEESSSDRRIVSFALNRLSEVYWEEIAEYLLSPR